MMRENAIALYASVDTRTELGLDHTGVESCGEVNGEASVGSSTVDTKFGGWITETTVVYKDDKEKKIFGKE